MKLPSSRALDLRALVLVVLVFDIADDHLDDVLDRSQAVGAAIFVDDERHMRARRLHFHQKIERRHRRRHEENRTQNAGFRQGHLGRSRGLPCCAAIELEVIGRRGDEIDEIADVDHAARIVESFAHAPAGANGRRCGTRRALRPDVESEATAMMSARGIMMSATRTSCSDRTFFSIARSSGEKSGAAVISSSAS